MDTHYCKCFLIGQCFAGCLQTVHALMLDYESLSLADDIFQSKAQINKGPNKQRMAQSYKLLARKQFIDASKH